MRPSVSPLRLHARSLRARLCAWYVVLTMLSLLGFGTVSYSYLSHSLQSARQGTLERRTERLQRFLTAMAGARGSLSVAELRAGIRQFRIVAPESDLLQVEDATTGERLATPEGATLRWQAECASPCFRLIRENAHPMRLLQTTMGVPGATLHVLMAGQTDEHEGTLRLLLRSYLLFAPLALLGSIGGGLLLAHRALRPIDRITREAATVGIHDLRRRLLVPQTGDELQRLAEAWNELLGRLDHAVSHLKQFTGDLSHDLRTSFTVMLASAEVALSRDRTPQEYRETLRTVTLECRATAQLLEDLLAASRAEEAANSIALTPVPLTDLLEEVCEQFRGPVQAKRLTLTCSLPDRQWTMGDASLLRRLAVILMDNAVKYTPPGGTVDVSLAPLHDRVQLNVSDTGEGIAPERLPRIFDRFYRGDDTRSRDTGSTGLGLAIARTIARVHGSDIEAVSQPGKGSRFSVTLRRLSVEEDAAHTR